jgi:REP element-mobilizing transposase RayT
MEESMENPVPFGVFDPKADVDISARNLPHWFQPGVAIFVTFRTADSMPQEAIDAWRMDLCQWLREHGVPVKGALPPRDLSKLPSSLRSEYLRVRDRLWHGNLDACHGECALRRDDLATIVMDSLKHFDGDRYHLDCAIVMPNHVHLLVQFILPTNCRKQCDSWLHFTAHGINKRLGRNGAFWQGEPFDHLVRSAEQFAYLRRYIARNGIEAKLPRSDYLFWRNPKWNNAASS